MNRIAALILALLVYACAPARPAGGETLTVFAAASLSEAFSQIGSQFEAGHPGVTVRFNFAGSQQLAHQLGQGAPADVFASADWQQMQAVIEAGRVRQGAPHAFARNNLAVIYPKENPAGLDSLQDLALPGVKLVLADAQVPAGRYSLDLLHQASLDPAFGTDFEKRVLANAVSYEQNVRAVLNKVALGEADAGIVYASDLMNASAAQVGRLEIPPALNIQTGYFIASLAGAGQAEPAQAFIDFILSPAGQDLLANFGFQQP